jgi:dipeptidyl-peptidase-4
MPQSIGNYPYVDKGRIGIFGWSYGGFMASNCILKETMYLKWLSL